MMHVDPVMNGVIKRLPGGELRVKLPDGSFEIVDGQRSDIALELASGRMTVPAGQRRTKTSPKTAKGPSSSGLTRAQVDTLGAALKPLLGGIRDRIEALERKPAGKAPDRPTTRRSALARAGDALEHAEAALRR